MKRKLDENDLKDTKSEADLLDLFLQSIEAHHCVITYIDKNKNVIIMSGKGTEGDVGPFKEIIMSSVLELTKSFVQGLSADTHHEVIDTKR